MPADGGHGAPFEKGETIGNAVPLAVGPLRTQVDVGVEVLGFGDKVVEGKHDAARRQLGETADGAMVYVGCGSEVGVVPGRG